jgi:hypothetical protein
MEDVKALYAAVADELVRAAPPMTDAARRRQVAYEAAVRAAIDAAPSVSPAERARLARAWRSSGSELVFDVSATQAA